MTRIVLKTIDEFEIDLGQLHNDSATITAYGEDNGKGRREKESGPFPLHAATRKNYRPDLKQLLFTLAVSRDGAAPIHYKSYDGNTADDKTHIQAWEALRRLTGRSHLCSRYEAVYPRADGLSTQQGRRAVYC